MWNAAGQVQSISTRSYSGGARGDFLTLVNGYAKEGIGLTAMGVGVQFGYELTLAISRTRGGNFFFLEDAEKLRRVFDEDFDYMVTPIAYDLHLELQPESGFRLIDVHGL